MLHDEDISAFKARERQNSLHQRPHSHFSVSAVVPEHTGDDNKLKTEIDDLNSQLAALVKRAEPLIPDAVEDKIAGDLHLDVLELQRSGTPTGSQDPVSNVGSRAIAYPTVRSAMSPRPNMERYRMITIPSSSGDRTCSNSSNKSNGILQHPLHLPQRSTPSPTHFQCQHVATHAINPTTTATATSNPCRIQRHSDGHYCPELQVPKFVVANVGHSMNLLMTTATLTATSNKQSAFSNAASTQQPKPRDNACHDSLEPAKSSDSKRLNSKSLESATPKG